MSFNFGFGLGPFPPVCSLHLSFVISRGSAAQVTNKTSLQQQTLLEVLYETSLVYYTKCFSMAGMCTSNWVSALISKTGLEPATYRLKVCRATIAPPGN
jgi:hypothetical protein